MSANEPKKEEAPWWSTYPAVQTKDLESISREELLKLIDSGEQSAYILIDVRRNDHLGGFIKTSINVPVQSLYPTIPTWYSIFKASGFKKIIWYCNSCGGRGMRATGWFQDYVSSQGDSELKSIYLEGGIKGWVGAGDKYVKEMIEFDISHWKESGVIPA